MYQESGLGGHFLVLCTAELREPKGASPPGAPPGLYPGLTGGLQHPIAAPGNDPRSLHIVHSA